jgi:hypothetical protein
VDDKSVGVDEEQVSVDEILLGVDDEIVTLNIFLVLYVMLIHCGNFTSYE